MNKNEQSKQGKFVNLSEAREMLFFMWAGLCALALIGIPLIFNKWRREEKFDNPRDSEEVLLSIVESLAIDPSDTSKWELEILLTRISNIYTASECNDQKRVIGLTIKEFKGIRNSDAFKAIGLMISFNYSLEKALETLQLPINKPFDYEKLKNIEEIKKECIRFRPEVQGMNYAYSYKRNIHYFRSSGPLEYCAVDIERESKLD